MKLPLGASHLQTPSGFDNIIMERFGLHNDEDPDIDSSVIFLLKLIVTDFSLVSLSSLVEKVNLHPFY